MTIEYSIKDIILMALRRLVIGNIGVYHQCPAASAGNGPSTRCRTVDGLG